MANKSTHFHFIKDIYFNGSFLSVAAVLRRRQQLAGIKARHRRRNHEGCLFVGW